MSKQNVSVWRVYRIQGPRRLSSRRSRPPTPTVPSSESSTICRLPIRPSRSASLRDWMISVRPAPYRPYHLPCQQPPGAVRRCQFGRRVLPWSGRGCSPPIITRSCFGLESRKQSRAHRREGSLRSTPMPGWAAGRLHPPNSLPQTRISEQRRSNDPGDARTTLCFVVE